MLMEVLGLSERWYQAWLVKDAATVERLMAEDYLYVGPDGFTLDRQASWRSLARRAIGWIMGRGRRSSLEPWARTRPSCGIAGRVPGRLRGYVHG